MAMPVNSTYDNSDQFIPPADRFQQGMLAQQNPNQARKMTAMETAQETFGAAHRLSDRVLGIVNRIAGHLPPEGETKAGPTAIANGVLDELRDGARSAHNSMARANEALDRLERKLS